LAAQAFELGLVDELRMFRSPVVVGGGPPFLPPGLRRNHVFHVRLTCPPALCSVKNSSELPSASVRAVIADGSAIRHSVVSGAPAALFRPRHAPRLPRAAPHRARAGGDEDAESLLHAALDKLPPESSAYRQVEEQLRRAS